MASRLFISHDHNDKNLAKTLARTISRITLGQLDVWFSSDNISSGGMQPGVWLDQIRSRLAECKAIIPLLTPSSIQRPWLLFETGYGASKENCEIIPIAVGIDSLKDISFPLAMYQIFNVVGYSSFRDLMDKILTRYGIKFDEEMANPILKNAISNIVKISPNKNQGINSIHKNSNIQLEEFKDYIDRRLFEFEQRLQRDDENGIYFDRLEQLSSYSIKLIFNFPEIKSIQYIEIDTEISVQDVIDQVYYMIDSQVGAFQYLRKWIMRDAKQRKNLVIREVADLIPAHYVFELNTEWEVLPLERPYTAEDSADHDRWYRI